MVIDRCRFLFTTPFERGPHNEKIATAKIRVTFLVSLSLIVREKERARAIIACPFNYACDADLSASSPTLELPATQV